MAKIPPYCLMQSVFEWHDCATCRSKPLDKLFYCNDFYHPTYGLKKDVAVEILSGIMSFCRLSVQRKQLLAMHLCGILWICYHQMLSQNHMKIE